MSILEQAGMDVIGSPTGLRPLSSPRIADFPSFLPSWLHALLEPISGTRIQEPNSLTAAELALPCVNAVAAKGIFLPAPERVVAFFGRAVVAKTLG